MINFYAIKQTIAEMEYGWKEPLSLTVLVPGLSLIFQQIQASHLISILKASHQRPGQFLALLDSREWIKLDTIYKWHAFGSLIQTISLLALANLNPLFLLPATFSVYEVFASCRGVMHKIIIILNGRLHFIQ